MLSHLFRVFIIVFGFFTILHAQVRDCYTEEYFANEIQANPGRLKISELIERHTENYHSRIAFRSNSLVTIPVVVHIVYNDPSENISTAQIISQIDVLNKDFRRLNLDANNTWQQAADTGIEFCLATVDPSGKSTTGITRTYTNASSFASNGDLIKYTSKGGKDAWPSENYLNIWVGAVSYTHLDVYKRQQAITMTGPSRQDAACLCISFNSFRYE